MKQEMERDDSLHRGRFSVLHNTKVGDTSYKMITNYFTAQLITSTLKHFKYTTQGSKH